MEPKLHQPFNIQSIKISEEVGNGAWGLPSSSDKFLGSSDASLFSSSLPVLKHEKLNFAGSDLKIANNHISKSNEINHDTEGNSSSEDISASHAIGSLLPDDEAELLAGIMDDFDLSELPSQMEDLEEYDIFDSGGGMEMDFDPHESLAISMAKVSLSDNHIGNGTGHYGLSNGVGTIAGEHPYGEHPSRTLFVRNINSNVEDSELRSLFEQYGAIRTLYTACKHRGFVMISYYDIRDARSAMRALQNKPLRRRKLDIHFSIPKDNPSDKDINQGTLVVFNLDPSVSNDDLLQIFGTYGEVKEIRETPHKRHHKFIEFYDVRAAEAALRSLNRINIAGKRIKLEPSRPGGARKNLMQQWSQELDQDETRSFQHQVGSPVINSPPGPWAQFSSPTENSSLHGISPPALGPIGPMTSNHMPGLASILPPIVSDSVKIAPIGKAQGWGSQVDSSTAGTAFQNSHSFPDQSNGRMLSMSPSPESGPSFGHSNSSTSGIGTLTGSQFLWGSPVLYSEHSHASTWMIPSMGHSIGSNGQQQGQGFAYSGRHGSFAQHHHVGPASAPSGALFEKQYGFFKESSDTSFMNPVSHAYGGIGLNRVGGSFMMNMGARATMNRGIELSGNISENQSPNFGMMSSQKLNPVVLGVAGSYLGPLTGCVNGLTDRVQSRRVETNGNQIDSKKQYQLDIDKIVSGEDTRTTLMLKNIPNKYTSKMLLAAIDENHKGTYDFLYLPIDFKNKCNVGYAFINMISPSHITPFYQAFNGKKWEKFNSEKVASLAYARIQGKSALVTHFQNSSLMNEDKRCRPILFHSETLEAGDQAGYMSPVRGFGLFVADLENRLTFTFFHKINQEPFPNLNVRVLKIDGVSNSEDFPEHLAKRSAVNVEKSERQEEISIGEG